VSTSRKKDNRVPRARRLRRDMTIVEQRLWRRLRELAPAGSHLRRQATIGPYIVDFACHSQRIVIELDGGQHGQNPQASRDKERDDFLRANGYRVLRFWNNDVMQNLDGVMSVISEAFVPPPTPNPSPPLASLAGGGEKGAEPSPPLRGGKGDGAAGA
jgi:very-short-patch-repair endonuclease